MLFLYLYSMTKDMRIANLETTINLLNETVASLRSTVETMQSLLMEARASKEADRILIKELCSTIDILKKRLEQRDEVTQKAMTQNRQLAAMVRNANKQNESKKQPSTDEQEESDKHIKPVVRRDRTGCGLVVEHVDLYADSNEGDVVEETGLEEESVRYVHVKGYVKEIHYHRHKQRINGTLVCPKAPLTPIQNSQYDSSFIAHIVSLRFGYALPIERVVKMINTEGFSLPKTTAFNLLEGAYALLQNMGKALHQTVTSDSYVGMDETYHRLTNCVEPNKHGKRSRKAYIWEMFSHTHNMVCYYFAEGSRSTEAGTEFIAGFKGIIQSDGYRFYRELDKDQNNDIIRVACIQHVNRDWINIGDTIPEAVLISGLFSQLSHEEHKHVVGEDGWTENDHLRWRQEYAPPILDDIEQRCKTIIDTGVPRTPMYKAAQYTLNEMPAVRRIFETAYCKLTNNDCELLNRDISLSRRNSLFFVSKNGAVYASLFYSLVASCKLQDIDPEEYLEWLMNKLVNMSPLYDYELLRPLLPDMYKISKA